MGIVTEHAPQLTSTCPLLTGEIEHDTGLDLLLR